jgi:hypothetical protein
MSNNSCGIPAVVASLMQLGMALANLTRRPVTASRTNIKPSMNTAVMACAPNTRQISVGEFMGVVGEFMDVVLRRLELPTSEEKHFFFANANTAFESEHCQ